MACRFVLCPGLLFVSPWSHLASPGKITFLRSATHKPTLLNFTFTLLLLSCNHFTPHHSPCSHMHSHAPGPPVGEFVYFVTVSVSKFHHFFSQHNCFPCHGLRSGSWHWLVKTQAVWQLQLVNTIPSGHCRWLLHSTFLTCKRKCKKGQYIQYCFSLLHFTWSGYNWYFF